MILLDSHIALATLGLVNLTLTPAMQQKLQQPSAIFVSVASVWELAIKYRLGKLRFSVPADHIPDLLEQLNIQILPVQAYHAFANVGPEPTTKDPFDRLLLGVCAYEKMKLMTFDKDLVEHPLAWRER